MLSDKHVQSYCQCATFAQRSGNTNSGLQDCKYLSSVTVGSGSNQKIVKVCTKLSGGKKNNGWSGGWYASQATGDNCPGYPKMLHVLQGFDVDSGPPGDKK